MISSLGAFLIIQQSTKKACIPDKIQGCKPLTSSDVFDENISDSIEKSLDGLIDYIHEIKKDIRK